MKTDDMATAINKILTEYEGATVKSMKRAVDKAAKEAVKKLRADSPVRTGKYSSGWESKKTAQTNKWAYEKVVLNKKRYYITHLLEKGHRKANGGYVAARPHIAKVEAEAIDTLVEGIKNDS